MKFTNTIKLGLLAIVIVVASLLIGFIIGAIDSEAAQDSGTKSILVIGVATLAFIALGAIAGNSNNKK
jgi:MFS-type transporter involved in bile tolerance (Atg22 family)